MSAIPPETTRRTAVFGALASVAALTGAPAQATPQLRYPLSLLYGRIGPEGFVRIDSAEQELWSGMAVRLAGLISRLEPVQQYSMLTNNPPPLTSENGNVLVARQIAANQGLDHIMLYASRHGRREHAAYGNWFSRAFNGVTSRLSTSDDAVAEAHIIATAGGPPILSWSMDAPGRSPLNPLQFRRRPEAEAVARLAASVETRLQADARAAFAAQRSIAD